MKKLYPLADNVLLKLEEEDTVTSTGLIQAHTKGERTEAWAVKATVLAAGPKVATVTKGNVVYVGKWEIQNALIDGVKVAVAKEKDILVKEA